jgi:putative citrate transport
MLVSIAVLPMIVPAWWDGNRNKAILSVAMSLPVIAVVLRCEPRLLFQLLLDYVFFLTLLGSLFVISGGIYVKGVGRFLWVANC